MREIKFRAWDNEVGMYINPRIQNLQGRIVAHNTTQEGQCEMELFTGLKDKNGKDVYEGDILELGGVMGEIIYREAAYCLNLGNRTQTPSRLNQDRARMYQIIGNIHENAELLSVPRPSDGRG